MRKAIVPLFILLLIVLGVVLYFKSIAKKSDINLITVPGTLVPYTSPVPITPPAQPSRAPKGSSPAPSLSPSPTSSPALRYLGPPGRISN